MYSKKINLKVDKTLGYEYFCDKTHPLANKSGKVYYHRHVASIKLGRWITKDEHVHHLDENKLNNKDSNLEVLSRNDHASMHITRRPKKFCISCGAETTTKRQVYCSRACQMEYTAKHLQSEVRSRNVKTTKPPKDILAKDLESMSWCAIGRKYNVTDNAVRKWARKYGLL